MPLPPERLSPNRLHSGVRTAAGHTAGRAFSVCPFPIEEMTQASHPTAHPHPFCVPVASRTAVERPGGRLTANPVTPTRFAAAIPWRQGFPPHRAVGIVVGNRSSGLKQTNADSPSRVEALSADREGNRTAGLQFFGYAE